MKNDRGFKSNQKVGGDHQEGISRVIQRGKPEKTWHNGNMSWKGEGADWDRKGDSLTPRKA